MAKNTHRSSGERVKQHSVVFTDLDWQRLVTLAKVHNLSVSQLIVFMSMNTLENTFLEHKRKNEKGVPNDDVLSTLNDLLNRLQ